MNWLIFYCGMVAGWLLLTIIEIVLRQRRIRKKEYYLPRDLIPIWRHRARRLMLDAPNDKNMITATSAMRHSATIYLNCMTELMDALQEYSDPELK